MFLPTKPSPARVRELIAAQINLPFSYPEVGATRTTPPQGYTVDHNRVQLGFGKECFERAVNAIRSWKQFDLSWVEAVPADIPIELGAAVGVLARHFGFWSLNVSRIVYLIDESGPIEKFGFAYGTLTSHIEQGEERFTVRWHRDDDSVWYDILAFSRPNQYLIKFSRPVARMLQRRFANDSLNAMVKAVK
ncbi:MAG: DUF1990 family protein [Pyrinomonadaceae bacterium]